MTIEQYISECLGESVGEVDASGNVVEHDNLASCPFLDGEILDVDVAGTFGGLAGVCKA